MSYTDLYTSKSSTITGSGNSGQPIATIFGVPFDSTHSYRPGTRFGPDAIRSVFDNIEIFHPNLGIDLEETAIEDLGNVRHTVVPEEMTLMVKRITEELLPRNRQIVALGGEHLVTLGAFSGHPKETGFVVFDAHYDLRDEYADARLSHATYLRRVVEERGSDQIVHIGARAFAREELEFLTGTDITTISDAEIRDGEGPRLLKDAVSAFTKVYVSYDLDVLDPAFAPGVGNPEAVGITPRELFAMIGSLEESHVVGSDIVELNPSMDNGSTAALAAKIVSTMIAMNAT